MLEEVIYDEYREWFSSFDDNGYTNQPGRTFQKSTRSSGARLRLQQNSTSRWKYPAVGEEDKMNQHPLDGIIDDMEILYGKRDLNLEVLVLDLAAKHHKRRGELRSEYQRRILRLAREASA